MSTLFFRILDRFQPFLAPEIETGTIAGAEIFGAVAINTFKKINLFGFLHQVISLIEELIYLFENTPFRITIILHLFHEGASPQPVPTIQSGIDLFFGADADKIAILQIAVL